MRRWTWLAAAALLTVSMPAAAVSQDPVPTVHVPAVDYPEGVVGSPGGRTLLRISIGQDGQIDCAVAGSSGNALLDEDACRLLRQRARFSPSQARRFEIGFAWAPQDGPRTADRGAPLLVWRPGWITPDDYPEAVARRNQSGRVGYEAQVNTSGVVEDCRVLSTSGSPELDQRTCEIVRSRGLFLPSVGAAGQPVRAAYRGHMVWRTQ
jgi:TonB family protein